MFEGQDDYLLGSPGEIMIFQENDLLKSACDIFRQCPLSAETAAQTARVYERKKFIDLLYPLLLMYRLVFYKKLNIPINTTLESLLNRKASALSVERIINTMNMLNVSICSLENNPNRLLLLFSILMKLP